jgi:hypothetical protein
VPLVLVPSNFGGGDVVGDLVDYVKGVLSSDPELRVELILPEWTASSVWWKWAFARMLHHLTGSRLKLAFLAQNRVTVTNHRYALTDEPPSLPERASAAPAAPSRSWDGAKESAALRQPMHSDGTSPTGPETKPLGERVG